MIIYISLKQEKRILYLHKIETLFTCKQISIQNKTKRIIQNGRTIV
jgi:hypothetical protein